MTFPSNPLRTTEHGLHAQAHSVEVEGLDQLDHLRQRSEVNDVRKSMHLEMGSNGKQCEAMRSKSQGKGFSWVFIHDTQVSHRSTIYDRIWNCYLKIKRKNIEKIDNFEFPMCGWLKLT